ncbi:MAG TPA: hypothetical protein VGF92_08800 [Stellaceae bacterium]|jgi:hypothetical protein
MEHGAKAATSFTNLIKQTAKKGDLPGRNRSLVIGKAGDKPVMLVSPKKPTQALSELSTMSKKLGKVTPLAIGQVVFEENVVHLKALKNANEAVVKKAFLDYYRAYKISPPSIQVKLWQPTEWNAVEFEEDPEDVHEGESDAATTDEESEDDEAEEDGDSSAKPVAKAAPTSDTALAALQAELARLIPQFAHAAGDDNELLGALKKDAVDVGTNLKQRNVAAATEALKRLKQRIDSPKQPIAGRSGDTSQDHNASQVQPSSADASRKELAALIMRIPRAAGDDTARKATLAQMAGEANAALKANNLAALATLIARLRAALDGGDVRTDQAGSGSGRADGSVTGAGKATQAWKGAHDAWQDANDEVNKQLNALRAAILDQAKKEPAYAAALGEIADKGLNAITGNHRALLMASLMDIGDGAPEALRTHGPKALGLVTAFQNFIAGNERIGVCDANPFGVPVSIRDTFTPALARLAEALKLAA